MTISEIAKLAGVSSAAVSRYLNDGSLSQEKRQRIERVIRETKYRPSEYARTMRTKKSNRIGVLVPQIDSESVPKILSGISERMDQKNYHVLLMNSNLSLEKEIGILETFEQSQVDGLIFVASVLTKRHEKALEHILLLFFHIYSISGGFHCFSKPSACPIQFCQSSTLGKRKSLNPSKLPIK